MKNSAAASGSPLRSASAARRRVASAMRSPSPSPGPGRAPPPRAYRPGDRLRSPRPARPGRRAHPPPRPDRRRAPTPGAARRLRPAPDRRFAPRASGPRPAGPAAASVRENDSQPSRSALSRRGLRVKRNGEEPPSANDTSLSSRIPRKAESLLDERLDRYRDSPLPCRHAQKRRDSNQDHPRPRAGCRPLVRLRLFWLRSPGAAGGTGGDEPLTSQ